VLESTRAISIKDLREQWHNGKDRERRAFVGDLLKVYRHNWKEILTYFIDNRFLEQTADKLAPHTDTSINLLRWVTDEIAAIYSQPAHRTINGSTEGLEPYENKGLIDHYLDNASKYTQLCRELAVRPLVDDGKLVLDMVTPDRFTVIPHPTNPIKFLAIIIQLTEGTFAVWTSDTHYIADRQLNPIATHPDNIANAAANGGEYVNPYGVIPYVVTHARFPAMEFFNSQDSRGLYDATLTGGVQMTAHNHLRHLQSFKQIVISGTKDEAMGKIVTDPARALLLPNPAASASTLDLQADLATNLETMFQAQRPTLIMNGIWADAIRSTQTGGSGYALSIKMHKQQVLWQQLRVLWELYENMILDVARVVLLADAGVTLPIGDLRVEYPDIGPNSDPKEQASLAESHQRLGMSRQNIWREQGKSEEWIAQNEEELFEEEKRDSPMAIPVLETGDPSLDGDPATVDVVDEEELEV